MDQMITNESSVHREPSQAEDAASDGQKRLTILKLNKADILITRGNKQRGDLQAARQILDDVAEASGDDAQVSALRRRLAETI
jgi:hypothetical protein